MMRCNYNSLAFFRRYFHIPTYRKLSWALIAETVHGETDVRLGVVFSEYPHVYLDVAMRRFFTESAIGGGAVTRKVFPARRTAPHKDTFLFVAVNGLTKEVHRRYIRDIYYTSVYSPELLGQVLY